VWDAVSGSELISLRARKKEKRRATSSPDGRRLLTHGYKEPARLWDAISGATLAGLRGHKGEVTSAS
jgi:WD40 repeat protein